MANKARECTNYSITEEATTNGYSQVLDSRENAAGVRNVYIGSSNLLKIGSSAVMGMHDIPVSYILALENTVKERLTHKYKRGKKRNWRIQSTDGNTAKERLIEEYTVEERLIHKYS